MKFIEQILRSHYITKEHKAIIYNHNWIDNRYTYYGLYNGKIICEKCKIEFGYVLYKHQRPDGTKWHELTCNEVLMKKLLE